MNTLVLAGNHHQYVEFLKSQGINPLSPNLSSVRDANGDNYVEGGYVGIHFDRIVVIGTFRQRGDALNIFEYSRACLAEGGKVAYDDLEAGWYANQWDTQGDAVMHDHEGVLRCNWCRSRCSETYKRGLCYLCHQGAKMPSGIKTGGLQPVKKYPMPTKAGQSFTKIMYGDADFDKPKLVLVRKEGDIWKLPKANSPMWTDQWGYQGSAKLPYIISKKVLANGSTTEGGWACSCMNFTRHTPRTPCKHILNVLIKEGMGVVKPAAKGVASLTDKDEAAFMAWKREQAALKKGAAVPTAGAKLNLFGATTRKFR